MKRKIQSEDQLVGQGSNISGKTILRILVILTVGAILTIYISDMLRCILEGIQIPALEIITFTAILAVTMSVVVFFSKRESTENNTQKQDNQKGERVLDAFQQKSTQMNSPQHTWCDKCPKLSKFGKNVDEVMNLNKWLLSFPDTILIDSQFHPHMKYAIKNGCDFWGSH